jgi:hypothetical protein
MNKEEIKALFPDDIEAITISKNDYDRLFGELTYKNIELQQRIDKAIEYINKLKEYPYLERYYVGELLEILGGKE